MFKHRADYYFWAAALLVLLKGCIEYFVADDPVMIINIGDTYYVFSKIHITLFNSGVFIAIGFIYRMQYSINASLNKVLTKIHTKGSVAIIVIYWIAALISSRHKTPAFPLLDDAWYYDTDFILKISIVLFILLQFLLIINIIVGLFRKEKQ